MSQKIFILDDHEAIICALKSTLNEKYPLEIDIKSSLQYSEMVKSLNTEKIDLLIIDYELSDLTAIDLIPLLKRQYPGLKLLIYTLHQEPWIISTLIKLEVDGIILKKDHLEDIPEAIKQILLENQKFYSPSALQIMLSFLGDETAKRSLIYTPTVRELEVIEMLSLGLTSEEIAGKLYLTKNAVDAMRKNILLKSGALNVSHLMRIAFLKGWITK